VIRRTKTLGIFLKYILGAAGKYGGLQLEWSTQSDNQIVHCITHLVHSRKEGRRIVMVERHARRCDVINHAASMRPANTFQLPIVRAACPASYHATVPPAITSRRADEGCYVGIHEALLPYHRITNRKVSHKMFV
jgi:hypothetical protein